MNIYEELESEVRSYARKFPVEFDKARNAILIDVNGNEYIDFFAGAGALNFGHNNPEIKKCILEYLAEDNVIHALDMHTKAKHELLECIKNNLFIPKNLSYKVMFCGSTGTNANEAALKLARKVKGREKVISCTGAFHGMTLGSLALTSDSYSRNGAGVPLENVTFIPYDSNTGLDYLEAMLTDDHSGFDKPSALFLETVQAEGGINVARVEWLKRIEQICHDNDILLVVDDIQVGVGRTGSFFSFERAGIIPDMVTLSKSISGFGLPMSLLLIKPEYDIFGPGEHNGTWRGNQLAFVGSKAGIEYYLDHNMDTMVKSKERFIESLLKENVLSIDRRLKVRGIGMIWGIDYSAVSMDTAKKIASECFKNGLIIELAGRGDSVLKILPPLTIEDDNIRKGISIIADATRKVLADCK